MYNKEVNKAETLPMAKKRTITATFEDGTTIQRVTDRIYTHAITTKEDSYPASWCGRPDLMLKKKSQLGKVQHKGTKYEYTPTVLVAKVTNDPWNFQKPE